MPHETLNRLLEYIGMEVDNHYVERKEFLFCTLAHVGDNFHHNSKPTFLSLKSSA